MCAIRSNMNDNDLENRTVLCVA